MPLGVSADDFGTDNRAITQLRAQGYPVLDDDVARERSGVREDRPAPDDAVVRHVRVGHEEVVVPDDRLAVPGHGAAVRGHELAEDVPVPDDEARRLSGVLQILGGIPDDRPVMNPALAADPRGPGNEGVRRDSGAVADDRAGFHDGEGSDRNAVAKDGPGADRSPGINGGGHGN